MLFFELLNHLQQLSPHPSNPGHLSPDRVPIIIQSYHDQMTSAAEAAIQELLSSLGDASVALDAEVLEYLVAIVEDPDPESSLELISSVLAECVDAFAALDTNRQTQLVLLDDVSLRWGPACTPLCAWANLTTWNEC